MFTAIRTEDLGKFYVVIAYKTDKDMKGLAWTNVVSEQMFEKYEDALSFYRDKAALFLLDNPNGCIDYFIITAEEYYTHKVHNKFGMYSGIVAERLLAVKTTN